MTELNHNSLENKEAQHNLLMISGSQLRWEVGPITQIPYPQDFRINRPNYESLKDFVAVVAIELVIFYQTHQCRYARVTFTSLLTMHRALKLMTRCSVLTRSIYAIWHVWLEATGNWTCMSYMSYTWNVCHASGLGTLQTSTDWNIECYMQGMLQHFQSCLLTCLLTYFTCSCQ